MRLALCLWLASAAALAPEPLLDTDQLAEWLHIPAETVRVWRKRNRGPRVIRVGKHARYRREDVEAWLDQQAN